MKKNQASKSIPATAGFLGTFLAIAPVLSAAVIPPKLALDDIFGARIIDTGVTTNREARAQSWLIFEGRAGLTYDVYSTTDSESWTKCGSVTADRGTGFYIEPLPANGQPVYELSLTLYGESAPPSWPAHAIFRAVEIGPTGLRVTWDAAVDDEGVDAYAVYLNGVHCGTFGPEQRSALVEVSELHSSMELDLVICDNHGNCVQGPPTLTVHTPRPENAPSESVFSPYRHVAYEPTLAHSRTSNESADRAARGKNSRDTTRSRFVDINGDAHLSPLDALSVAAAVEVAPVMNGTDRVDHIRELPSPPNGTKIVPDNREPASFDLIPHPIGPHGRWTLFGIPARFASAVQSPDSNQGHPNTSTLNGILLPAIHTFPFPGEVKPFEPIYPQRMFNPLSHLPDLLGPIHTAPDRPISP